MTTDAEVDAAGRMIYGDIWPTLNPGLVRKALEAAERERDEARRRNCQHPNKQGSGALSSDGSGYSRWYCPSCGKSGGTEWPAPLPTTNGRSE